MPATSEPPSPAKGPEIHLGNEPMVGGKRRLNIPEETISAINDAVAKNAPPPAAEAQPPPEPPKPPTAAPASNGEPKKVAPESKPVAAQPTTPPKSDKEENLANLRKKLEAREAEFATLQNSLTATTKEKADALQKIADTEARVTKLAEEIEKDYKPRAERLKVVEQELQKREEVLKMKAYQETPEFHEKYVKPLADAQGELTELLTEVLVDNGDGTARQATADDFGEVLAARTVNEAYAVAQKKFGVVAQTLVNFRTRIRGLERNRSEATKKAGEMALEYEQRRQTEAMQQFNQVRTSVYTEAERMIKETLGLNEEDTEEKEAFSSGSQFADSLWNNDGESVDQVVRKMAKARKNNIEAPVLRKRLDRANKRIAELETNLKEYQKSEPQLNPRGGNGQSATAEPTTKEERRAALVKAAQDAAASTR